MGNGTFATLGTFGAGTQPRSIRAADFDADGDIDLVVANALINAVSVLLNDGTGGFATRHTFTVGTSPQDVTVADFDRDLVAVLAVHLDVEAQRDADHDPQRGPARPTHGVVQLADRHWRVVVVEGAAWIRGRFRPDAERAGQPECAERVPDHEAPPRRTTSASARSAAWCRSHSSARRSAASDRSS